MATSAGKTEQEVLAFCRHKAVTWVPVVGGGLRMQINYARMLVTDADKLTEQAADFFRTLGAEVIVMDGSGGMIVSRIAARWLHDHDIQETLPGVIPNGPQS